jgi:hypothetical protein
MSGIVYLHFLKPTTKALARFCLLPEHLTHAQGVRGLPDSTGAIAIIGFYQFPVLRVNLNDLQRHLPTSLLPLWSRG